MNNQMEEIKIFMDKALQPTDQNLAEKLGSTYQLWILIRDFVKEKYPTALEEWNYPGAKYGWSFRMKDKKRAIIYLLPYTSFFKVAFVFGQKATDQVIAANIAQEIKTELENARVYAEGRGIRIDVTNESKMADIRKLIEIKLAN
jgi:hypothetical protein